MTLAMFDLDHTLLDGDSDSLWGEFLISVGAVDARYHRTESARYARDYRAGTLDTHAYYHFCLAPLGQHTVDRLMEWRDRYLDEHIRHRVTTAAKDLLDRHRAAGHTLMIVTATNRFLTQPIAELLEVDTLLATELEMIAGRYTGRLAGAACMSQGKLAHLRAWLEKTGESLEGSWFYSDSNTDLPLLEEVDHPVAVNPDPILADHARARNWPILDLSA